MTSPDSITQIAALGLEPVYSAREAAVDEPQKATMVHRWGISAL
jgi:hypothetical protein